MVYYLALTRLGEKEKSNKEMGYWNFKAYISKLMKR